MTADYVYAQSPAKIKTRGDLGRTLYRPPLPAPWTDEDDARLREAWASDRWIAEIVKDFPGRSHNALCGRARRLNLPRRHSALRPFLDAHGRKGLRACTQRYRERPRVVWPDMSAAVAAAIGGAVEPRRPYRPGVDPRPQFSRAV